MTVVSMRDVTIEYDTGDDPVVAVESMNLEVEHGEFVCLLGPSGCGKSTALKGIAGLLEPARGDIEIDFASLSDQDRIMVWQEATLMPWRTILGNVAYPLELTGVGRKEARRRAREALGELGIGDFANKYPRQLSGGMKQRAGIARALVADPRLLLMDEPFAALDAQTRRLLQEALLSLWNDMDKTVIFVTHSVEEAILLGDRIVVMTARPGRVKAIIDIPFTRPRSLDIRREKAYGDLEEQIWALLHVEAEKAEAEIEGGG